ncbi:anti-sigma factor domain-containing protein [Alicyclobacillus sp.]|uniref:anti-sigma factor domain-containing protein n=1 Tax=Alicyclobacillus sp. TaxID=61169 RepID=UPI0025BE4B08|nr:anti-sigma factor domain-containing protein [Alicyclobacillus sp.]MCL6516508.1 anti-sigma factor domain-containing protein [Alicyclobacillus sp.]
MRRNGIVLELHPEYAIVLSRDGEFCRIPGTAAMDVGVEVVWDAAAAPDAGRDAVRRRVRRSRAPWRRLGFAGMAASLVAAAGIWFGTGITRPSDAYASVAVDVNPSVTLQVDRNLRVLNAWGNDADGALLVKGLQLTGHPLRVAVQEVVEAAGARHALDGEDAILVSAAPATGTADVTRVEEAAAAALAQWTKATAAAPHLYTITLSPAIWQAASTAKISPGRLAAYLVAEKEGVHVASVNDLSGPSLVQVLSNPVATSVLQMLSAADVRELESFIDSLHLDQGGAAVGPKDGAPSGSGHANASAPSTGVGSQPGAGAPQSHRNGTGNGQGNGHSTAAHGSGRPSGAGSNDGSSTDNGRGKGQGTGGASRGDSNPPHDDGPGGGGMRISGSVHSDGTVEVQIGDRVISVPVASGVLGALGQGRSGNPPSGNGQGAGVIITVPGAATPGSGSDKPEGQGNGRGNANGNGNHRGNDGGVGRDHG